MLYQGANIIYETMSRNKNKDNSVAAKTLSPYDKLKAFWAYLEQHYDALKAYTLDEVFDDEARAEAGLHQEALEAMLRDIHPDMSLLLCHRDEQLWLYIPMDEKPHIYFLTLVLERLKPTALEACVEIGYTMPDVELPDTSSEFCAEVFVAHNHDGLDTLRFFSKSYNLYDPELMTCCRQYVSCLLGIPYIVMRQIAFEVVDEMPEEAIPLKDFEELYQRVYVEGEYQLNPMQNFLRYNFNNVEETHIRRRGSAISSQILDEIAYNNGPRDLIDALAKAGAGLYTLLVSYPGDSYQVVETRRALVSRLSDIEGFEWATLPVGYADGGKDYDIELFDFIHFAPEVLREQAEVILQEANCRVEIVQHVGGGVETIADFDVRTLPIPEMEARNAPSTFMLEVIEELPERDKTLEVRIVEARAYNGLHDFDKAIECFKACEAEAPDDGRIHYGLGYAYHRWGEETGQYNAEYLRLALEHFLRCVELEHRLNVTYYNLSRLLFANRNLMPNAYQEGLKYYHLLKACGEEAERFLEDFYDFEDMLSAEDSDALADAYEERFGKHHRIYRITQANGEDYELVVYPESERTAGCHIVVTRGFSSLSVANEEGDMGRFRFEHILALPATVSLEALCNEHFLDSWIGNLFIRLKGFYNRLKAQMPQSHLHKNIDDLPAELFPTPYEGHAAMRMMMQPEGVLRAKEATAPITLPSGEVVHFVGITPMYNEEAIFVECSSEEEVEARGIWSLSPIYEVGRPNYGLEDAFSGEIDFSAFMDYEASESEA